ncbi:MAG TPA: hypothetical protein VGN23_13250 [Verrucomicrobiae bacterium]|jgi:sugar lactone lactonase YvrE
MNHKFIVSWRSLILSLLAIALPGTVSAQTNYYWQTIATSVTASGGPQGVGVDPVGDLFIANTSDNTILKATPVGTNWIITTIAGGAQGPLDGTNNGAQFYGPFSLAVQDSSTLYVADSVNNAIREVQLIGTNWVVTTIAGICAPGGSGFRDGTNQYAQFSGPNGITLDRQGNLYVADTYNHVIREIRPSGTNWITTTIVGAGSPSSGPGPIDGTNQNAQFDAPYDVTADAEGKLFVADYGDNAVCEVVPMGTNWVMTTISGGSGQGLGSFSDGTNLDAQFAGPTSIAVDGLDNVYVADLYNNAIRKISPAGGTNWLTTTIGGASTGGGSASNGGLVDGTNAVAEFNGPNGVAVDLSGNIYIGDTGNNALRVGYLFPPSLNLVLAGNQATVSYPASLGTNFGFVVQATTNIGNPVWVTATNRWLLTTNSIPFNVFTVTNKVPSRYFRLQMP